MSKRLVQLATALLLFASVCFASDKPTAPVNTNTSTRGVMYVATLRNGFSIRFDHREETGQMSRLFLDATGESFVDVSTSDIASLEQVEVAAPNVAPEKPQPKPVDIPTAIATASDRHGIDADLLYSVIRAESDFNPHAVSRKGARGLMQLMPGTAGKLGVSDSFDAASNVDGGTKYLRELLDRYHYDLAKALAAYNAGPARVDQYHGVPPFHETRVYVARIIRDYNKAVVSRRKAVANPQSPVASRETSVMSSRH